MTQGKRELHVRLGMLMNKEIDLHKSPSNESSIKKKKQLYFLQFIVTLYHNIAIPNCPILQCEHMSK